MLLLRSAKMPGLSTSCFPRAAPAPKLGAKHLGSHFGSEKCLCIVYPPTTPRGFSFYQFETGLTGSYSPWAESIASRLYMLTN